MQILNLKKRDFNRAISKKDLGKKELNMFSKFNKLILLALLVTSLAIVSGCKSNPFGRQNSAPYNGESSGGSCCG